MWSITSAVVVIAAIILGFSVIGSPRAQRLLRYDSQKVSDLQNIQWQVVNHWQRKGALPASLDELKDPLSGYQLPSDPQTKENYEYRPTGAKSFQLCAVFNKEPQPANYRGGIAVMPTEKGVTGSPDYWNHGVGRQCFDRTIDESLYPITKPMSQIIR